MCMWALGWPIHWKQAAKAARDAGLSDSSDDDEEAAIVLMTAIVTMRGAHNVQILDCLVDNVWTFTVCLCTDETAKTIEEAKPQNLPSQKVAIRIGRLMQMKKSPKWYEACEGGCDKEAEYIAALVAGEDVSAITFPHA